MPRRDNRHTRGGSRRRPIQRLLVVCGGVRTEPAYLRSLVKQVDHPAVAVTVRSRGVSPAQLVRIAATHRNRAPDDFDHVWCISDVDEFDIAEAVRSAAAADVHLAASNPCFELWLLLHHADCQAHCNGCVDVRSRLLRHVPDYDKTRLVFDRFADGVDDAIRRAKALEPTGTAYEKNPSSGVWRVVEQILDTR